MLEIRYQDTAHKLQYEYDKLGRIQKTTLVNGASWVANYSYAAGDTQNFGAGATTPLVAGIAQGSAGDAMNFAYTYDGVGNITSETRDGLTTTYMYDGLGQLIRVNDPHQNATWVYEYDQGGNILNKKRYAYTTGTLGVVLEPLSYTYGDSNWKDKLTSYNGNAITYDNIGNPLEYDGWTYTWQAGRQLQKMESGEKMVEFTYDASGLRIQKKVTEGSTVTTTDYTLHGKLIMHQTVTKVVNTVTASIDEMHFFYNAQGRPQMVSFNGTLYTYVHNLQGDIVGIVDGTGAKVVEYKYDAWGKPLDNFPTGTLKDTLGVLNPFRYRGYVWDEETGHYYLRARYYDPELGRFISEDISLGTGGLLSHNQFAYCKNNPLIYKDVDGTEEGYAYEVTIRAYDPEDAEAPGHYEIYIGGTFALNGESYMDAVITYEPWKKISEGDKSYKGNAAFVVIGSVDQVAALHNPEKFGLWTQTYLVTGAQLQAGLDVIKENTERIGESTKYGYAMRVTGDKFKTYDISKSNCYMATHKWLGAMGINALKKYDARKLVNYYVTNLIAKYRAAWDHIYGKGK